MRKTTSIGDDAENQAIRRLAQDESTHSEPFSKSLSEVESNGFQCVCFQGNRIVDITRVISMDSNRLEDKADSSSGDSVFSIILCLLVIPTLFYLQGYYLIVLCCVYGLALSEFYQRSSWGRRTRTFLRAKSKD